VAGTVVRRARDAVAARVRVRRFVSGLDGTPRDDARQIGSDYGGWVLPLSLLGPDSVCYLIGVGEDITFDLALIARFGCTAHAFDPVPRAQRYAAEAAAHEPRHIMYPYGIWSQDTTLRFFGHSDPTYVSHSATNLMGTSTGFDAEVRSIPTVMAELGHDHIDLLKISAEGSEYEIVDHVLASGVRVGVLCVEFAQPAPIERAQATIAVLRAAGLELVRDFRMVTAAGWKLTFVAS
jgi:FkbM family methyltransferase